MPISVQAPTKYKLTGNLSTGLNENSREKVVIFENERQDYLSMNNNYKAASLTYCQSLLSNHFLTAGLILL